MPIDSGSMMRNLSPGGGDGWINALLQMLQGQRGGGRPFGGGGASGLGAGSVGPGQMGIGMGLAGGMGGGGLGLRDPNAPNPGLQQTPNGPGVGAQPGMMHILEMLRGAGGAGRPRMM